MSRESKKTIFTIFPGFFIKMAGNPGISSETTRESRVRRPWDLGPWSTCVQGP